MKKTLITGAIASIAIIGAGTFFYLDEKKAQDKVTEKTAPVAQEVSKPQEQTQTVDLSKNDGYCLIRYQISTDNGKNWTEVVVKNGLDPINTQDCWTEYGDLLKKFDKEPDADGHLHGTEDGNPIASPSMAFSSKPISLEEAHQKDAERQAAAEKAKADTTEETTDTTADTDTTEQTQTSDEAAPAENTVDTNGSDENNAEQM